MEDGRNFIENAVTGSSVISISLLNLMIVPEKVRGHLER
jgi:hypothetical protein